MNNHKTKKMTENVTPQTAAAPAAKTTSNLEKYPAMHFVVRFAKLTAMILAFFFLAVAIVSVITGIFSEDRSFVWGLINAGFTLLVGSVLIGLVKGMGEAFELLLNMDERVK